MLPLACWLLGTSRSPGVHASEENRFSTAIRRYDGSGSSVTTVTRSTSSPRTRSRRRSTIGLLMLMSPPPPLPGPMSKTSRSTVGISSGTMIASAVTTPPIAPALARTAPVRTPNASASPPPVSRSSERPQRETCSSSWMNSIIKKPPAVSANTHHAGPDPSVLSGTLKMVRSGRPASGTRRRVQASTSTSSMQARPPTMRIGSTPGTSSGTGGANLLALSRASRNSVSRRPHAEPTGSGDPVMTRQDTTPVATTWAATTTPLGARHQRARTPVRTMTAPSSRSGPRKRPEASVKPRQDRRATHVVPTPAAESVASETRLARERGRATLSSPRSGLLPVRERRRVPVSRGPSRGPAPPRRSPDGRADPAGRPASPAR